jgi:adenylate kinase
VERRAILLLGSQGAGKGTLGAFLAGELDAVHLSAGELLRERIAVGGRWAGEIQGQIDRGLAVPTEISYGLLEERLRSVPEDIALVLDGFPREAAELPRLNSLLGGEADLALLLNLPRPIAVARLREREACKQCGASYGPGVPARSPARCDRCGGTLVRRADDSPRALARRLDGWSTRAPAIIAHFRAAATLIELDASLDPAALARRALGLVQVSSN